MPHDIPSHKISRPIIVVPADSIERLQRVLGCPGLMAFCRIIGLRMSNGKSLSAQRMLQAAGVQPEIAHQILEGWPLHEVDRATPCEGVQGLDIHEEAAVRFSTFIDDVGSYDWPTVLIESLSSE